jgi:hypothetical protein
MKRNHVTWLVYRRDQIKADRRGRLIYILEMPAGAGCPVLRHVFDPIGRLFPACTHQDLTRFVASHSDAIVFHGISLEAAYGVMLSDPRISQADTGFAGYNRELLTQAQSFFLDQSANCKPLEALAPAS